MKTSTKLILSVAPLVSVAACFLAFAGLRLEPSGYVASYSFFPHDPCDVLDFSRGTVTLRTCCGDSPQGTYSQRSDGAWVWHYKYTVKKQPVTEDFVVHPTPFAMTFVPVKDPSKSFTLRRRVFKQVPL